MLSDQMLLEVLTTDTPLIDVRAPVEFAKGAFPSSVNLPILDDAERTAVGTRYKEDGHDAAVALGHQLVTGVLKSQRTRSWCEFKQANPDALLYCFRGGVRSELAVNWMHDAGETIPRIDGGYKRLRNLLIDQLARLPETLTTIIMGGRTGTGKTSFIRQFDWSLDLEGLAHHRGSAFGKRFSPQPSQINFENSLAVALMKHVKAGFVQLLLEDESRAIGSLSVPQPLFERMKRSPIVILETDLESRVDHIFQEYIKDDLATLETDLDDPETALQVLSERLLGSLDAISRRLGGANHQQLTRMMHEAFRLQATGDASLHKVWIRALLEDYYDPMYDYQLERKQNRIIARGQPEEVREYLKREYRI